MGQTAIYNEFQALCAVTELKEHGDMLESGKQYSEYNRYCDILTYKDTRVKLNPRSDQLENDYINACFVDVRKIIFDFCCRGLLSRNRSSRVKDL
jgi:protein tyrosine phosphatase